MVDGPTDQQRTIVLGRTGSGKSQFSIALLSTRNFDEMPWIIIDYKGEDLIEEILTKTKGRIKHLKPTDNVPKRAGLYYMKPMPLQDDELMEAFLWRVHKSGYCGLFIDEGYALPKGKAFDVILTQGRSLHIPVIALYQRPVYMSRFAVAQADFFAVFEQNDTRDLKITAQFVKPAKGLNNETITVFNDLPRWFCLWYNVGQGQSVVLSPAPQKDEIIKTFVNRLNVKKARAFI